MKTAKWNSFHFLLEESRCRGDIYMPLGQKMSSYHILPGRESVRRATVEIKRLPLRLRSAFSPLPFSLVTSLAAAMTPSTLSSPLDPPVASPPIRPCFTLTSHVHGHIRVVFYLTPAAARRPAGQLTRSATATRLVNNFTGNTRTHAITRGQVHPTCRVWCGMMWRQNRWLNKKPPTARTF